jgi:hypothetical protein
VPRLGRILFERHPESANLTCVSEPLPQTEFSPGPNLEETCSGDLLLWLLRRRSEGEGAHRAVRINLHCVLGPVRGEQAAGAISRFFGCLARHARRPLRFDLTGANPASADERAVLALVAAAARGQYAEAGARARWLVPERDADNLLVAARQLAAALA